MEKFLAGLAEILEVEPDQATPEMSLASVAWDSLAIISTISLIDEQFEVMLDGDALAACTSVADIQKLIESAKKA